MEAAWTGLRVACVALGVLSQVAERGGEPACCCRLRLILGRAANRLLCRLRLVLVCRLRLILIFSAPFDFYSSTAFDFYF